MSNLEIIEVADLVSPFIILVGPYIYLDSGFCWSTDHLKWPLIGHLQPSGLVLPGEDTGDVLGESCTGLFRPTVVGGWYRSTSMGKPR